MKKVLVTGSTGFIGQYVVQALLDLGLDLQIIASGRSLEKAKTFEWYSDVIFIPYDISEQLNDCFQQLDKPDLLIHLAWDNLGDYKNTIHLHKHLFSHYHFLRSMLRGGLEKLVVTGTCFEYGKCDGSIQEELEVRPLTNYAIAKDLLRRLIELEKKEQDFGFSWIRLFYTYGLGQRSNALLPQLDQALERGDSVFNMSPGDQCHDYLPIEVMSEYIVKLALQDSISGVINCCSGQAIKLTDLVKMHLADKKKNIDLNLGYYDYSEYEPKSFWGDVTKLKKALHAFDDQFSRIKTDGH